MCTIRARSSAKEVNAVGCQGVSETVSTITPDVLAVYILSCKQARLVL